MSDVENNLVLAVCIMMRRGHGWWHVLGLFDIKRSVETRPQSNAYCPDPHSSVFAISRFASAAASRSIVSAGDGIALITLANALPPDTLVVMDIDGLSSNIAHCFYGSHHQPRKPLWGVLLV